MDLRHFLRTLAQWWIVPVSLVALCLVGVHAYHRIYGGEEAETTVAVLDPLVARPTTYGEAQIGFDAVLKSRQLAERVAVRIGRSADWVQGKLSVSVSSSLSPGSFASPMFNVRAKGETTQEAQQLTIAAAEEARRLYIELNTADPDIVRQTFAAQRLQLDEEAAAARRAFYAFTDQHRVPDLPALIAKQRDLTSALRLALLQGQADAAAADVYEASVVASAAGSRSASLAQSLELARSRLETRLALEPRYNELALAYQMAQSRLIEYEQRPGASRDATQLSALRADLQSATTELNAFIQANDALDLPAKLATSRSEVAALQISLTQSRADQAAAGAAARADPRSSSARRSLSIADALALEDQHLSELLALEPRYNELAGQYAAAQVRVSQLAQYEQSLIIGQRLPLEAQIKVLDQARPRSQLLWLVLTYSLGGLLGLFLGATAVYAIALVRREPTSAEEVAAAFRAPVLVRIAGAGRRA